MIPQPLPGTTKEGTRWAYRLMEREASGESLPIISTEAWRHVLGFPKDMSAKNALEIVKGARA